MGYFVPVLGHNQQEPLPFQYLGFKFNFLWPLNEKASRLEFSIKRIAIVISLVFYVATVLAQFTFLFENMGDIPAATECLSTSCMGFQYLIRISLLAARQDKMRKFLKRFYEQIYFTTADDPFLRSKMRNILRIVDFSTRSYYIPMLWIIIIYVMGAFNAGMASNKKPHIYPMSFHFYDAQAPLAFILTGIYTGWLTVSSVAMMAAEDYYLCIILCHTSYRFKELQQNLKRLLDDVRHAKVVNDNLYCSFRERLYMLFDREQQLKSFVYEAQDYFTYQIFLSLFFGVALLCVVAFQFQKTEVDTSSIFFHIFWLFCQTAQTLMMGYFGQMLSDEVSALQQSFFDCNWEFVLAFGNVHQNKWLMKDISFAIMNAKKPIVLAGMKMLPLTHKTVGRALRTAVSYFMFLNTMNDAQKS